MSPCYQGDPYPGFYFGVLGGQLQRESWLDLRGLDDVDAHDADKERARADLSLVMTLDSGLLRQALNFVASANDTSRLQERAIRDMLAQIQA